MQNADKMIEYLAEACKIAFGAEWDKMTGKEQHDTIMGFIAAAAREGRREQDAAK